MSDSMEAELLDWLIATWPVARPPMSEHLALEVAAVVHRRRPLAPGELVPGCGCPTCTSIGHDNPARRLPRRRRETEENWDRVISTARATTVLEAAGRLGLNSSPRGREWVTSCPVHEERTPSCYLNDAKSVWHCFGCGAGGDAIDLVLAVRGGAFADAVRWLASFEGNNALAGGSP